MSNPMLAVTSFSWISRCEICVNSAFAAGMFFEKFQMPQK